MMTDPRPDPRPWVIDREPTNSPTDPTNTPGSRQKTTSSLRNFRINPAIFPMHSDKDLDKALNEAVRKTEENHKKEIEELKKQMAEKEAAHRRLQVKKVQETEATFKRKIDETEAAHKKKVKRLEGDLKKKKEEIGATYERKIQETLGCVVCSVIAREGHILQCQNGHLFCEGCADQLRKWACPTCKLPLDQLTGNKRIRVLAIEQLIEAVDLKFPCKHANCQVAKTRSLLIAHENKCGLRKVPCPDAGCTQLVPFRSLLDHLEKGSEGVTMRSSGILLHVYEIPDKIYSEKSFVRPCTPCKFEDNTFLVAFVKLEGIYYTYMYMHGDQEEAMMFKVTITIGGGTQSGILHHGQIFPIDAKKGDIIKAKSGVLSFTSTGMGDSFFQDQNGPDNEKKITIQYKISKVPKPADPTGFDVSSRVEVSSNGFQLTECMAE